MFCNVIHPVYDTDAPGHVTDDRLAGFNPIAREPLPLPVKVLFCMH